MTNRQKAYFRIITGDDYDAEEAKMEKEGTLQHWLYANEQDFMIAIACASEEERMIREAFDAGYDCGYERGTYEGRPPFEYPNIDEYLKTIKE